MTDFGIELDIAAIETRTERLKNLDAETQQQQRAIDGDKTRSDSWKKAKRAEVKQWGENEKFSALQALWGTFDSPTGQWSGGKVEAVKTALDSRVAELTAAATDNDPLDSNRVLLAIREVESIAQTVQRLDDLLDLYAEADAYQRRALQTIGGKLLADKFPRDPRVVSTAKRWRADLQADRTSPEMAAVEELQDRLKWAINRAHGITSRVAYRAIDGPSGYPARAAQFHKPPHFGPGNGNGGPFG